MSKKKLFMLKDLFLNLLTNQYPPSKFNFKNESESLDLNLIHLGKSDDNDLIPSEEDISIEEYSVLKYGGLTQFLYACEDTVEIHDVALYKDCNGFVHIYAIRSREKPKNKRK